MSKGSENGMYSFDRFKLDAEKLMLYRDEIEISLPPKIVQTLAVLIKNRGSILSKGELIDIVWSDSIVEESNLSQNLYILRKTLGSKPDGGQYIETLRRRGYRFTGDVQIIERTPEPSNGHESPAARSQIGVERQGNVLRLVDWPPSEEVNKAVLPIAVPPAAGTIGAGTPPHRRISTAYVLAALIGTAGVVLLVFTASWFLSIGGSQLPIRSGDIKITRLTNENYVRDATISRDGKYFAYSEQVEGNSRLWIQQTGQASRVEIFPVGKLTHSGKTFTPDGKFLYFTAWSDSEKPAVYRVPTFGGTPEKVVANVSAWGTWVSFSPDGSELVFRRPSDAPGSYSIVIAPSNGRGAEREVKVDNGGINIFSSPAWSPDGKTLVVAATVGNAPSPPIRLFTLDLETGITNPLNDEIWTNIYRIEWLRDGGALALIGTKKGDGLSSRRDQVYMVSYPDGRSRRLTSDGSRHEPQSLGVTDDGSIIAVSYNRSSQIWSMDAGGDSRTAVQLTTGVSEGRGGIATLPDGRIGYSVLGEEGVSLWVIASDGSGKKRLLPESRMEMVSATPDGRYFVFKDRIGDYEQLYRVGTEGGEPMQLTFDDDDTTNKDYISISPDGHWVAYQSAVFQEGFLRSSIRKVAIEGGKPQVLVDDGCNGPEYSPDGRYFSCAYEARNRIAIRSVNDNSLVSTFEAVRYSNLEPKWAPDSLSLVYIVQHNNVCNLWKQPIDGGKPEQLTDFTSGQCHNFAYSRDGLRILLARGYEVRDAILIGNY